MNECRCVIVAICNQTTRFSRFCNWMEVMKRLLPEICPWVISWESKKTIPSLVIHLHLILHRYLYLYYISISISFFPSFFPSINDPPMLSFLILYPFIYLLLCIYREVHSVAESQEKQEYIDIDGELKGTTKCRCFRAKILPLAIRTIV